MAVVYRCGAVWGLYGVWGLYVGVGLILVVDEADKVALWGCGTYMGCRAYIRVWPILVVDEADRFDMWAGLIAGLMWGCGAVGLILVVYEVDKV